MKKVILMLLVFIVGHSYTAQTNNQEEKDDELNLKELAITNPPSIILLGISPSELETPKSKKGIIFSLVNSFKKNEGIPDTYAFEVTPFWILPSRNMNSLKFAGINEKSIEEIYKKENLVKDIKNLKIKQNIFGEVKKASISLGFVRDLSLGEDDNVKNPAFSVSMRGTLIRIRTKKNKDSIVLEDFRMRRALKEISDYLNENKEIEKIEKECKNDACQELLNKKENELLKKYPEDKKAKNKNTINSKNYYRNLLEAPPLLSLDIAGGYSTFFSDNKFSNNHFGKLGFWLTLNTGFSITKKGKPEEELWFNFYGIGRYLEDGTTMNANQQFIRTRNIDFGGKTEFTYKRLSISYEYIYRINDIEKTFRSSGLIAYKVSDKVYINAAFGKNYGEKDNLISFLGLNWGLDSERKSVFVNEKNN